LPFRKDNKTISTGGILGYHTTAKILDVDLKVSKKTITLQIHLYLQPWPTIRSVCVCT